MKIPRKPEMKEYIAEEGTYLPREVEVREWDYKHDDRLFGEIAGHVFNHYVNIKKRNEPLTLETIFRFTFGSTNPNEASLYYEKVLSDIERVTAFNSDRIKEHVYENACHSLIQKALENSDIVHKLKGSFWKRLKFLFTPTTPL